MDTEKELNKDKQTEHPVSEAAPDQLQEKIAQLEEEKTQLMSRLQRACADFDNIEKRLPKRIEESVNFQKESMLKALLPGIDNFDHALNSPAGDIEGLLKGVKMVYDHFLTILKGLGVEQIQAKDLPFDPSRHQAMMQRCENDKENGLVLDELQKGYLLNGRVLRPSMVIVNKLQENEQCESESSEKTDSDNNQ